jgi:hypothetical protein
MLYASSYGIQWRFFNSPVAKIPKYFHFKVNKYCVLSGEAKHDQQEREEFTAEPDFEPTLADEETIASESPKSTQHVLE